MVGRLRLLAVAGLALCASACSILFLATDPLGGVTDEDASADASADADAATDAASDGAPDAGQPSLVLVQAGVGAVAVFADVVYANLDGQLATCDDGGCHVIVPVEAGTPLPLGLAADDAGVFWVAGEGIWGASLDGGQPGLVIQDDNKPCLIALDGARVSWTTSDDGGASVIRSCLPRKGVCKFTIAADGGAAPPPSGGGSPVELVDGGGNVDKTKLAAGPGFVLWVTNQTNEIMTYTPVDGGTPTTINAKLADDGFKTKGVFSTTTLVTNDGPNVFYSFFDNQNGSSPFELERSQYPADAQGTVLDPTEYNQSDCLGASSGLVAYCPRAVQMYVRDGVTGALKWTVAIGAAQVPLQTVVATSSSIFLLDKFNNLYRYDLPK